MEKSIWKDCKKHGYVRWRLERKSYRCTKCRNEAQARCRKNRKKKLIDMLGGKCVKCGYNKSMAAMEFHHRDSSKKGFNLHLRNMGKCWEILIEEVKKCDLVCANCHAEIHETNIYVRKD